MDLSAPVGTTFQLTDTSTVTIIDPYDCYLDALNSCFDFDKLREFVKREDFSFSPRSFGASGSVTSDLVFQLIQAIQKIENQMLPLRTLAALYHCLGFAIARFLNGQTQHLIHY